MKRAVWHYCRLHADTKKNEVINVTNQWAGPCFYSCVCKLYCPPTLMFEQSLDEKQNIKLLWPNTIIGDLHVYSCVSQSHFAMPSCLYGVENLTLRISIGVRSILATSRATLPWPSTTALSALRSGFNYRGSNTYMCTCTFSSRIMQHHRVRLLYSQRVSLGKKGVTKIGYMYITENIGGNKLSPIQ